MDLGSSTSAINRSIPTVLPRKLGRSNVPGEVKISPKPRHPSLPRACEGLETNRPRRSYLSWYSLPRRRSSQGLRYYRRAVSHHRDQTSTVHLSAERLPRSTRLSSPWACTEN